MEKKTVLVTGIGGNVGQGIVRNLRLSGYNLKIIGTNSVSFSAGNHLVDYFYTIALAFEPDFLDNIIRIVDEEKVDLIIPSTDYEIYYLSHSANQIKCKLAVSGPLASKIYLDKYLTWLHHSKNNIPFSISCLPSEYKSNFEKAIAKPRKGRGSRGIMKLKFDTSILPDEEYMIQELHEGIEVTTAVYVSYITGKIIGLLNMERSLENGATNFCKVNTSHDEQLLAIANEMVRNSDLRGSFNIQSIVTSKNEIVPFEINCRISGTNSIRTHFGFKDVQYTAMELLYGIVPSKPIIMEGLAQRILMDVIYPNNSSTDSLLKNNNDTFIIF